MTAPSETPLTEIPSRPAISQANLSGWAVAWAGMQRYADHLETALAESRAECERLRTQSDSLNTLNLGQIKIIAKLQSDLREAETSKREAYERAAKVCEEVALHARQEGKDRFSCIEDGLTFAAWRIRALSGELREG